MASLRSSDILGTSFLFELNKSDGLSPGGSPQVAAFAGNSVTTIGVEIVRRAMIEATSRRPPLTTHGISGTWRYAATGARRSPIPLGILTPRRLRQAEIQTNAPAALVFLALENYIKGATFRSPEHAARGAANVAAVLATICAVLAGHRHTKVWDLR
jgi:hypothetical protein